LLANCLTLPPILMKETSKVFNCIRPAPTALSFESGRSPLLIARHDHTFRQFSSGKDHK
jgi:hypothetical protein